MKIFNTFILMAIACACVTTASDDVPPKKQIDVSPEHKTLKKVVKKIVIITEVDESASGSEGSDSGSGSEENWAGLDSIDESSSTSVSDSASHDMDKDEVIKIVKGKKSVHNVKAVPVISSPHPTTTPKKPIVSTDEPTSHMKPEIGSAEAEWDSESSSSSSSGEGSDSTSDDSESNNSDSASDDMEEVKVIKIDKGKKSLHNVKAVPVTSSPHPTLPPRSSPHPTTTPTALPITIDESTSDTTPEIGSAEAELDSVSSSFSGEDSDSTSDDSESNSESGSELIEEIGLESDSLSDSASDSMDDEIKFPVDPITIDVQTEVNNEGADALTMAVAVGCIVGFIAIIVVAIIAVKKNAMYSSSILGAMATETNANSTDKAIDGSDEEASTDDALERGEGAPLTSRSVTNGDAGEIEGKFE